MEKQIQLIFVAIIALIQFSSALNYCNIRTCPYGPLSHTLCKYNAPGPSLQCKQLISAGLTGDEKQRIINLHNKLRQKVATGQELRGSPGPQPRAAFMPNLVWDHELAEAAQRWADQCSYTVDQCRDVERFQVNQNIGYSSTTANKFSIEEVIESWYNRVQYFNRYDVSRYSGQGYNGQSIVTYSQIVWAKTTNIGCGAVKHNNKGYNTLYLVCNYGPAGNILNYPVYQAI